MATTTPSDVSKRAIALIAPDEDIKAQQRKVSIFLAGSIDKGEARDWQPELTSTLSHLPVAIYNPRRPNGGGFDWNANNNALFKEQVDWEHKHLTESSIIAMFFAKKTSSPITLLELGLFATSGRLIVGCEKEYWRHGNVEWVCNHYNIMLVDTLEELATEVEKRIMELENGSDEKVL